MKKITFKEESTLMKLQQALARLLRGEPQHVGARYRISISAVCKEAGISRQCFYTRYRSFEKDIKEAGAAYGQPKVSRSRRRELDIRAENEELRRQLKALLSEHATFLHRAVTAEKRLQAVAGEGRVIRGTNFAGRPQRK